MNIDGKDRNPDISVIIVAWNGKRFVFDCVKSLSDNRDVAFEIIVVDNASSDGTPEMVKDCFPEVRLVELETNCGFAKGNNIGIAHSKGKYLFLINSDVTVPPGCLKRIHEFMEQYTTIGLLGPQMLAADGRIRRSTMRFPNVRNSLFRALALDSAFGQVKGVPGLLMNDFDHDRTTDVEVLNGWFWVARRQAVDHVGLLDEQFFMYGEDIDWCYRFHQCGWRIVFFAGAAAVHYGGASSDAAPLRFYIEKHRANLQYWHKHHGRPACAAYAVATVLHHCLRIVGYAFAYITRITSRFDAAHKMRRSGVLLGWLLHLTRISQDVL